jgi:hypothetical protein
VDANNDWTLRVGCNIPEFYLIKEKLNEMLKGVTLKLPNQVCNYTSLLPWFIRKQEQFP